MKPTSRLAPVGRAVSQDLTSHTQKVAAKNACQAASGQVSCLDYLEIEITITDTAREHHALPAQDFEGEEGT
jgi:hypothetical protein